MGNRKSGVTIEQRKKFGKWMTQQHLNLMQREGQYLQIKALADRLGMERATVSKYLDGIIVPSGDTAIKIANFFQNDEIYDILDYERPELSKQEIKEQTLSYLRSGDFVDNGFLEELEREIQNARSRQSNAANQKGRQDSE